MIKSLASDLEWYETESLFKPLILDFVFSELVSLNNRVDSFYCITNNFVTLLSLSNLLKNNNFEDENNSLLNLIYGNTLLAYLGLSIYSEDDKQKSELVDLIKKYKPVGLDDDDRFYNLSSKELVFRLTESNDPKSVFVYFNTVLMYETDFIASKLRPKILEIGPIGWINELPNEAKPILAEYKRLKELYLIKVADKLNGYLDSLGKNKRSIDLYGITVAYESEVLA